MIPRFANFLVPVDFTAKNWSALDVAFEFAAKQTASVTLLHVIETIDGGGLDDEPDVREFYARMEERAVSELENMAKRFAEADIEVHEVIRFGKRVSEIVGYSNKHETDLIILSSHALSDRKPTGIVVTLSYQVSLICSCPVLLVK